MNVINFFIENKDKIDFDVEKEQDNYGMTVFDEADVNGHSDIVSKLVMHC